MKRFYCIVCKKMKRVRQYPVMIQNASAEVPTYRVGTCNRHLTSARLSARKIVGGNR